MDEHLKQVTEYINQHLQQGQSEQAIRDHLLKNGWTEEWINKAFNAIRPPVSAAAPLPPQAVSNAAPSSATTSVSPAQSSQPEKYGVFQAVGDTFRAIGVNLGATLAAIIIPVLFIVVIGIAIVLATFASLGSPTTLSSGSFVISVIVAVLLITVLAGVVQAFSLSMLGIALNDGAEGRKSPIGPLFKRALQRVRKVFLGSVLLYLYIVLPLIAFGVVLFMTTFSNAGTGSLDLARGLVFIVIMYLVALIWSIIMMLRYGLMPIVALFEPNVPVFALGKRSKQLLFHGGQWFLVKSALLLFLIFIIISILGGQSSSGLQSSRSDNTLVNLLSVIVSTIANGVLVMLYRNRKAVKG